MDTPYEQNKAEADKYTDKAEDEKKKVVSIVLTICFASIGFSISQLTKTDFQFNSNIDKYLIFYGLIGLILTIVSLLAYRIYLYLSYSHTAGYHTLLLKFLPENVGRSDDLYKIKFWLLPISLAFFVASELVLLSGFMVRIFFK